MKSAHWAALGAVAIIVAVTVIVTVIVTVSQPTTNEPQSLFAPDNNVVALTPELNLQMPGFSPTLTPGEFAFPGWPETPQRLVLVQDDATSPLFVVVDALDRSFTEVNAAGLAYVTAWGPYQFGVDDPSTSWDVGVCRMSLRTSTSPSPTSPSVGVLFSTSNDQAAAVAFLAEDADAVRAAMDEVVAASCG